jgi:hypothetical protein
MMRATTASEERLVALAAAETRGPRRDGLYALWLVVRAAEGLLPPDPVARKTHQRRLHAIAGRLGGLALAAPLRRALAAACQHLEPATPTAAALVLSQLVAPAREVLGAEVGDAIQHAARAARAAAPR